MTGVKICGINSAESFDTCIACGVDWIGFVFFPPSPRYVQPAVAAQLSARHQGGPRRVGLLVDPADPQIAELLAEFRPDILQIFAPASRIGEISARFGIPVWRAIGVRLSTDLPSHAEGADGFVVDAPAMPGTRPGGNAKTFDWSMLTGWQAPSPWLLAGGLTPMNVKEAIRVTNAPAVDVSSGVEAAPGQKDPILIRQFVNQVRAR